MARGEREHKLG